MTELDISLFKFFNGFSGQSENFDWVIVFFAEYVPYLMVAAFLIVLIFQKSKFIQKSQFGLSAAIAAIFSQYAIVSGIRFFYHHPRPFIAIENANKLFAETGYSFPSAHATLFFALSAVIYRENKAVGIIFFVLSALMGMARVSAGVHYPFDILGGALLGTIAGFVSISLVKTYLLKRQSGK
jgi:undecaprenyl-diphosphatase